MLLKEIRCWSKMEGEYCKSLSKDEVIFYIIRLSITWELIDKDNDYWGHVFNKCIGSITKESLD